MTPRSRPRDVSRRLVLDVLGRGPAVSMSHLAQQTGLSRATVAAVIAELRALGRVRFEDGATGGRGRPPTLVSATAPDTFVGAVDLSHSLLRVAVASIDGELIAQRQLRFNIDTSGAASIHAAARELRRAATESGVPDLDYVMLGVPGPLEFVPDGSVRSAGILAG